MPRRSLFLALLAATLILPASAQETISCAPLLSATEVEATCGVSDFGFEVSEGRESGCQITALRSETASGLVITLAVQDNAEAARLSVEAARGLARVVDDARASADDTGDANQALGQVLEAIGVQESGSEADPGVSDAEAAMKELPDLGDGGVRYLSDVTAGMGLVSHTVVFSSGALLVKLESSVVAGRAGVCTVETLEPLARRIATRL